MASGRSLLRASGAGPELNKETKLCTEEEFGHVVGLVDATGLWQKEGKVKERSNNAGGNCFHQAEKRCACAVEDGEKSDGNHCNRERDVRGNTSELLADSTL